MSSRSASRTCLVLRHVVKNLGPLAPLFRGRDFFIPYIQAGAPSLAIREGLTGHACELMAGRAALCMNEWLEAAGL